jgi:hypothetical protein
MVLFAFDVPSHPLGILNEAKPRPQAWFGIQRTQLEVIDKRTLDSRSAQNDNLGLQTRPTRLPVLT